MTIGLLEKDTQIPTPEQSEDDVSGFIREIRKIPRLTAEQEQELAKRCADGDEEAVRILVSSNLALVISIAREYAGRGVPLMDLVQEGSIGLLTAAKKFDYRLHYRFSTYATDWILQSIRRYLESHGSLIRIPRHTGERIRKLQKAAVQLRQEGKEATAEAIAQRSGIPEGKVAQYLMLIPEVCSLDAAVNDDATLQELLENVQAPEPLQELVRRELKETMNILMTQLTLRQQQVLRLRFGMEDGTCYSLEKIGVQLGISKERARQIEKEAIEKLHRLGIRLGLEDFLA
jgi:RNA polymerase primary sigma factor